MNTTPPSKDSKNKKHWGSLSALFKAVMDPRTPWYAKLLPIIAVVYVVFPFDLVPDVVPFAGWVDDLIVLPAGMWLATRYIPKEVIEETGAELSSIVKKFKRTILLWGLGLAAFCALIAVVLILIGIWLVRGAN